MTLDFLLFTGKSILLYSFVDVIVQLTCRSDRCARFYKANGDATLNYWLGFRDESCTLTQNDSPIRIPYRHFFIIAAFHATHPFIWRPDFAALQATASFKAAHVFIKFRAPVLMYVPTLSPILR